MHIKNNIKIFFIILFVLFLGVEKVSAATINISSSKNFYRVGDTIRVNIYISSDKPINAISGEVSFQSDYLSLSSISKNSSIINLWAVTPSFSNENGTASFEGVVLNGFTGSSGNIVTLLFKAKKIGVPVVSVKNASILANDGSGTNVIEGNLPTISFDIDGAVIDTKNSVDKKEEPNKEIVNENIVDKVSDVADKMTEKVSQVEVVNDLPSHSLLITVIILLIIAIILIIITGIFIIVKIKRYFKNKLNSTKDVVNHDLSKLENIIDSKIEYNNKNDKITKEETYILDNIDKTKNEIIKEIDSIDKNL